jgi:hypothetical protein
MAIRIRTCSYCLSILLSLVASTVSLAGQSIDRMMAIVDGEVITSGDLIRYRRFAELFGFGPEIPVDDREALLALIDERLIDAQVRQFPVIRVSDAQVRDLIEEVLADSGSLLPPELIATLARRRLERMQYFDIRFRQFVTASDEEVQDYYQTVFVPEARARGLDPVPSLQDIVDEIRQNVLLEQTNDDVTTWVDSLRRRSEIEIVE